MKVYKKCTAKPCYCSTNVHFRGNILERIWKIIVATKDKIRDEKVQYHINKEAAETAALSSSKTDKCENLTGEEILPPDQSRVI